MSQRYPSAWRGRADPPARGAGRDEERASHAVRRNRGADGVRFAVWAPSANEAAVEIDGRRVAMERAARGLLSTASIPTHVPGARYAFRFDTTDIAIPDPASRFNPDGVHAPSEVVDASGVRMARRRLARAPLGRSRHLRAARRHVYARRNLRRGRRAARLLGRARREHDRAHAARGDARPLELGLRRRAAIRAARRLRPSRRPEALRRCGSCTRPLGVARRGLQPLRARRQLSRPLRTRVLHGAPQDTLGRRPELR